MADHEEHKKKKEEISPFQRYQQGEEKKASDSAEELQKIREEGKLSERELRLALLNILEDTEEARQKVEQEAKKTQTIIYSFSDGIFVIDEQGVVTYMNPEAEKLMRVSAAEVKGKSISKLLAHEKLAPLFELVKGEGVSIKKVYRKELELSELLTIEVSTIPLELAEKRFGTLLVLHDITREKRVERMKTEFVTLAAHQLRTPLSGIKWALRMLIDEGEGLSPLLKEGLDKAYASNERMINLVNDLLNATRIEEGRYVYKPVPGDFQKLVDDMITTYEPVAKEKKVELKINKPKEGLPPVAFDTEKMNMAVQNLIDNAIKYTASGGKVTVTTKVEEGGKDVRLSVEDTGVGIPPAQKDRIFSKFFRAENVMRMETVGNGLGLFIAKNIVESHGGKIWFTSELNKGTTFYMKLPVTKEGEKKGKENKEQKKKEEKEEKKSQE